MGMQSNVCMHPSLQVAKRKTQRRIRPGHAVWVFVEPAGCTCLSLGRGGGVKNSLPLNGVLGFWTVVLKAAVRPECGLLRCFRSGISETHLNPSNDGLDLF